jgi:RNA polymerase sigma-70 factor (ECF subfamily)
MLSEKELVEGCKSYNAAAQKLLYAKYSSKMYAICVRYVKDKEEAKDLLQEGFIRVFSNIDKYSFSGSLEGWIRRVIINIILYHIKSNKKYKWESIEANSEHIAGIEENESFESEEDEFTMEELEKALNGLPEVYRVVFNLYHIDEFSHAEIGNILSIDETTSRTRLFRAKTILKYKLDAVRKLKYKMER